MAFPVIAICEICFCAPTIIFALIPLLSCHQRVPLTSSLMNLLSNGCWAACVYGLYEMTHEDQFDFDKAEIISICTFVAAILVYLLFKFRLLTISFCSEHDSIGYVQSMVKNSFFDILVHYFPNGREVSSMAAGNSSTHQVQAGTAGPASAPCDNAGNGRRKIVHEQ